MDFELFKLFFGTYLESYLARECNAQQTCKWQELAGKITSLQDCKGYDHMIILFESMTETNSVSNGLKKIPFKQTSRSICYAFIPKTYLH